MSEYKIIFARSARKELQGLPLDLAERVLQKIELLSVNARPLACRLSGGRVRRPCGGSVADHAGTWLFSSDL